MARQDFERHGRTSLSVEEVRDQIDTTRRRYQVEPDGRVVVRLTDDEQRLLNPEPPPRSPLARFETMLKQVR